MATGKITKQSVDQLSPAMRDAVLWDSELRGFGLKITRSGTRTYIFQYRMGGRETPTRRYTIGQHGSPWTPALARKEAEGLALRVAQGVDPNAVEHERKKLAVDLAFDVYSERFRKACGDNGWGRMVERTLRLHLTPFLKRKPLNTITRADVSAILDAIPSEKVALKRNTFAILRRLFRWAISRGDLNRSPCEGIETPRAVTPRDRVLSDAELARVWDASMTLGKTFGPIVRLLIASGQRREEVSGLDWSELDRERSMWTLPKERAKNGFAHTIPLNELAMQILTDMSSSPTVWPASGLVFATRSGKKFVGHSKGKQQLDGALLCDGGTALPSWRLHDIRRTVATGFQRLGVRFEVTEAILNHLSGSKAGIAGTYQRHEWLAEKREALDLWAKHLRLFVGGVSDLEEESSSCAIQQAFAAGVQLGVKFGRLLPHEV